MILALFFTRGVSLREWVNKGLFDREKLLYEYHLKQGNLSSVFWLTYGSTDFQLAKELKKDGRLDKRIQVIERPRWFPHGRLGAWLYSFALPFVNRSILRYVDILKTNQMDGAWSAWIAAKFLQKPLLLRTGYTKSFLVRKQYGNGFRYLFYRCVECSLYRTCNSSTVSSQHDREYVCSSFGIESTKVHLLPNFVATDRFRCEVPLSRRANRLLFVGRLHPEKNIENLIRALPSIDIGLDIFGDGQPSEIERLLKISESLKADVVMKGMVSNSEMPGILGQYKYFILPSLYEGNPKALIEAMACGLVCIGTKVPGIEEILSDGLTGIVCKGTGKEDLLEGLRRALVCRHVELAMAARNYAVEKFSLAKIASLEKIIMNTLRYGQQSINLAGR
jgi:glycosyltransferase involved in cell wall biosynthesis